MANEIHQPDSYHVAVKAFVVNGDKILICYDHRSAAWDLPGGRINVDEFEVPLVEVLRREIVEEIGAGVQFTIGSLVAVFRHRRPEGDKPEIHILMLGYEVTYAGGDIELSEEHTDKRWLTLPEAIELLPLGQADGVRQYLNRRSAAV